jgi:ADP-heptose:LPS heptosyltransferase
MWPEAANLYNTTRDARKIVVVDLGFLGDTVQLVPALWEIKRNYPRAALHVLTTPVGVEVLGLLPCLDLAWPLELAPAKRSRREHWRVIRRLRGERFDIAFNFSGADRTIFVTGLSGACCKVAHEAGRKHIWNRWLIPNWVSRRDPALPAYEQRRQVLAACGLTLEAPRWDLAIPEAARRRAETLAPGAPIHFSINASSSLKEWPVKHWIELAQRLLAEDARLQIVATGTASERERRNLEALASAVHSERLAVLPLGLAIAELAAVLQRCRLHVGADSGVLHLAVAVGLPTVSVFRNYNDARAWMPFGPNHRVLTVACECVNQDDQPCARANRARCLAELHPALVAEAVQSHLRSLNAV